MDSGAKKLFVDDIRKPPDDSWFIARSVSSAINSLTLFDFSEISLDHDISHQVIIGEMSRPYTCVEDFSAVAEYIALKYKSGDKPKITIHTANPVGALRIARILDGFQIEIIKNYPANRLETQL